MHSRTIFSLRTNHRLTALSRYARALAAVCSAVFIVAGCGGGGSSSNTVSASSVRVADTDSPYAEVLVKCVSASASGDSCRLTDLPLLGQETLMPSVDDIMQRTVVSDEWMAQRFRQMLVRAPREVRRLFASVTGVVIARDIRPSNYTTLTGAIYLDPRYLWLTVAEKRTVSTDPDFRADFGNDLGFVELSRYVRNNQYAWKFFSLTDDSTRTLDDIELPFMALLLHELAHANDFFPRTSLNGLDSSRRVVTSASVLGTGSTSNALARTQPLASRVWDGLGEVLYQGRPANARERALTPSEVGLEFADDGASDPYAYASVFEDTAMLFEEVMMKYLYDIDRELAFTSVPGEGLERFCDFYVVRWGVRGRAGDARVKSRAAQVLELVLDKNDVSTQLAALENPLRMTNGRSWCNVQNLTAPATISVAPSQAGPETTGVLRPLRPDDLERRH